MVEIQVTGNPLEFEKIAYNASWRNFIFAILGRKSFSTSLTTSAVSRDLRFLFL